uniref:Phosphatidylserine decarboxylase proenzyme, mitochondrial n=1 Tax=Glossina morsitans morsitans TaxID=37546 RepID=A0ABK9N7C9_GLOMM
MVSYFMPRGRFLIKPPNFRQLRQKHHQQESKWPVLRSFRQNFSQKNGNGGDHNTKQTEVSVRAMVRVKPTLSPTHSIQQQGLQQERRNALLRWTGFLLKWAPVGICVFGAIEWQLNKQNCIKNRTLHTATQFQSKIYSLLPLRLISRCWGWLASCYIPESVRPFIFGLYINTFKVNLEEALYPDIKHYKTFAEFFTRPLRDGVRTIDSNATLVSPADGKILHLGKACRSLIEQVKGVNYNLADFLGPTTWLRESKHDSNYMNALKYNSSTILYHCVIYLAPGDYHRFHSPADWNSLFRRHFTGELFSVSPRIATWLPGLFCLNERVLYVGEWEHGFFSFTAVGATNVGSVQIFMDSDLKTNQWAGLDLRTPRTFYDMTIDNGNLFKKGDLVGQFNMGSTIVLLFEAPLDFEFKVKPGQKVKVGQSLGRILN